VTPSVDITWSNSNDSALSFVGGNMGSTVTVKGLAAGETTKLTAHIVGSTIPPAEFNVKVTGKKPVKARIWIVCDSNGVPCVSGSYVTNRVNEANVWLDQTEMDLQIESIVYTNCQNWLMFQNPDAAHAELGELPHPGGYLKIVFVNEIVGARGFNGDYCIGMTTNAVDVTLAHEVCHAGGLRDIYPERGSLSITDAGVVQAGYLDPNDWGAGYYQKDLQHTNLITRLLMYYTHHDNRGHIPHGKVYGVYRPTRTSPLTIGKASVGLDTLNPNPAHPAKP